MSRRNVVAEIHHYLIGASASLAVAESLTAGYLQTMISSRSGASKFFLGGITAYSILMKVKLLGVDEQEAQRCDAVSPQVAADMAHGVTRLFGADFGIATTGYAESQPAGEIDQPYAHIAIAKRDEGQLLFQGVFYGRGLKRNRMQVATAAFAIDALVKVLRSNLPPSA